MHIGLPPVSWIIASVDLKNYYFLFSWGDLITTSMSTMKKLALKIDGSWERKDRLCSLENIRRVPTSLSFHGFPNLFCLLPKLESIAENIRRLEFSHTHIKAHTFCRILSFCISLQHLKVHYSTIHGVVPDASAVTCLESLTIEGTDDLRFLRLLGDGITDLKVTALFGFTTATEIQNLRAFLSRQSSLKNFSCRYCESLYTILSDADIGFKLERLVIEELNFRVGKDIVITGMKKLLSKQRATLKTLELSGNICGDLLVFVVQELRVERLKIHKTGAFWHQNLLSTQISPNYHLKKLHLGHVLQSLEAVDRIFQAFPSIEYLKINERHRRDVNKILKLIANSLTKLVVLDIPLMSPTSAGVSMKSLKMVKLNGVCYNVYDWNARFIKEDHKLEPQNPPADENNSSFCLPPNEPSRAGINDIEPGIFQTFWAAIVAVFQILDFNQRH